MQKTLIILTTALVVVPLTAGCLGAAATQTRDDTSSGGNAADGGQAGEPFEVEHGPFMGTIGCTVAVAPITPTDYCKRVTDVAGVPNDQYDNTFSFQLPAGTTAIAVHIEAEEGIVTPVTLHQSWNFGDTALQIPDLRGVPPLSAFWEFPPETAPEFTKHEATAGFTMRASGNFGEAPTVVLHHTYVVYITSYHNGDPSPDPGHEH